MYCDISKLKVFEFESGETDCVIAKDYQEACNYYKNYLGEDDLNWFNISEVDNWQEKIIRCEASEKQRYGTYWENRTMADITKELYSNGYTGAEIISTTYI
jgi:hypothetical protein